MWDVLGWAAEGGGGGICTRGGAWFTPVTQSVARCEWSDALSQLSGSSVYRSTTTKQHLSLFALSRIFRAEIWLFNLLLSCWTRKVVVLCFSNAPPSALQFFLQEWSKWKSLYWLYIELFCCCCCCYHFGVKWLHLVWFRRFKWTFLTNSNIFFLLFYFFLNYDHSWSLTDCGCFVVSFSLIFIDFSSTLNVLPSVCALTGDTSRLSLPAFNLSMFNLALIAVIESNLFKWLKKELVINFKRNMRLEAAHQH